MALLLVVLLIVLLKLLLHLNWNLNRHRDDLRRNHSRLLLLLELLLELLLFLIGLLEARELLAEPLKFSLQLASQTRVAAKVRLGVVLQTRVDTVEDLVGVNLVLRNNIVSDDVLDLLHNLLGNDRLDNVVAHNLLDDLIAACSIASSG